MMEMKSIIFPLSLAASLLSISNLATAQEENLIANGGFEETTINSGSGGWEWFRSSQVSGWEGSNIEIWQNFGNIGAYAGSSHAELNAHPSNGRAFSIYQTFSTTAGKSYDLFFAYGARSNTRESFKVEVADQEFTMDDHEVNRWSTFSQSFVAQSEETTLRFTTISPFSGTEGNFIDAISVTAVPEPEAPMQTSCQDMNGRVDRINNYIDVEYGIKTHNYCGSVKTSCNKEPSDLSEGINDVRCETEDSCGSISHCDFTVTIPSESVGYNRCDYEGAPLITQRAAKSLMWPPTHSMSDVGLTLDVVDCDSELTTNVTTEVWSNEPEYVASEEVVETSTSDAETDTTIQCGNTASDSASNTSTSLSGKCGTITREDAEAAFEALMAERNANLQTDDPYAGGLLIDDDSSLIDGALSLRMERESDGSGRIYMIITRSTDSEGNSHQACTPVMIPKEMTLTDIFPLWWEAAAATNSCTESGEAPEGYHQMGD